MGSQLTQVWEQLYSRWRVDIFKFAREAWNFEPTKHQAEAFQLVQDETYLPADERKKRLTMKSGQGTGKCLNMGVSATRHGVYDAEAGRYVPTAEIVDRLTTVACMDHDAGDVLRAAQAAPVPQEHPKPCLRIRTALGDMLELSTDHPVYTPNDYVQAGDLKVGDFVAAPRHLPASTAPDPGLSDAEVVWLAAMFCDGCNSNSTWTHLPNQFTAVFEDACNGAGVRVINRRLCGKAESLTLGRPEATDLLKQHGLDCLSKHKRVPPAIFQCGNRQIALFLNAMWSCDGYYEKQGPRITLASEEGLLGVRTLLLRLGIVSRVRYRKMKCQTGQFDAWEASINSTFIDRFLEVVGPSVGREVPAEWSIHRNTNVDVVPLSKASFQQLVESVGHTKASARSLGFRYRSYAHPSRASVDRFLASKGVEIMAGRDVVWTKIEAIEDLGTCPVVDLTVPGFGNFVAGGMVVHNTTVECVIASWRALQGVDSLVVVTAPTAQQIKDVWISEFRRLLQKAHPIMQAIFDVDNTKIRIMKRPTWGIWTRSASRPQNFQGYHQDNLTFIVDEASGVERDILETIKGTLTNENSLLICAGNPNTRESAFFDMFYHPREKELWHKLTFNAEASAIVDKENLKRLEIEFGKESDIYRVRVLGEFPLADPNCIMSTEELWTCTGIPVLDAARMRGDLSHDKQFGIDLARYGSDESIIYRRSGLAVVEWLRMTKKDPMEVLQAAMEMQRRVSWSNEECLYVVDAGGIGQGAMGHLYKEKKRVHEFRSEHKSTTRDYANKMTEAWFHLAKLVRQRKISIPDDHLLVEQLSTRFYETDNKNRLILEKKDQYIKRGYKSPDRADALAMAFYEGSVTKCRISAA